MTETPFARWPDKFLKGETGGSRQSDGTLITELFGFPMLNNLGDVLDAARARRDPRGRRPDYPPSALLAANAAARVAGSTTGAVKTLREPLVWPTCQEAYWRLTGVELPDGPPNRDHIQEFRATVAATPGLTGQLAVAFTRAAVRMAQRIGNLTPGVDPDWAAPRREHVIYGDGTIVKRYSDAEVIFDPFTEKEILIRSRAKSPGSARIQKEFRVSGEDGKKAPGINNVLLHTRTPPGQIVLAVGTELGAEVWTALDLVDLVMAEAGDGVHTLVYDGAVTGWAVEYLMAHHRVRFLGKVPAASSKTDAHKYTKDQLDTYLSEVARERGLATTGRVGASIRQSFLREMYSGDRPTPVGTTIYPPSTPKGEFDHVLGVYVFTSAEHTVPGCTPCTHTLVMDNGDLFTVTIDPASELLVKDQLLPAISCLPRRGAGGRWGTTSTYQVPCTWGDFSHTIEWDPAGVRFRREDPPGDRSPKDPLGWRLQPPARNAHGRHQVVNDARNDSEQFNAWYKAALPHGRAASLSRAGQALDLLSMGLVKNSDTWHRYQLNETLT